MTCTESFYKDSIVEEIKSRQVDEGEKRRMFEMLQKFEKESAEQADELEGWWSENKIKRMACGASCCIGTSYIHITLL